MESKYKYYSFFTQHSLMENYGFVGGLLNRTFRKILPEVPAEHTFEFYLKTQLDKGDFSSVIMNLKGLLSNDSSKNLIETDLNLAIVGLSTKILSFGLDQKFQAIFEKLNVDTKCFYELLNQVNSLSQDSKMRLTKFNYALDSVCEAVITIRRNKNVIGTSLHLTVVTKNLLSYAKRIKVLLDLRSEITSEEKWEDLIADYISHQRSKNDLNKLFVAHTDLLALEIVEHTAQKGESYVAETPSDYKIFFKKGLLGGLIIAVFALFKIMIDAVVSAPIPSAVLYSINYALCFVLVYLLGGTIATKQPAMTASTIARHIDKDDDLKYDTLQDIILLLRKIFRSQFISLLGNFIMAFAASSLIGYLLNLSHLMDPISDEKSLYLIKQVFPIAGGALFYAMIAGVFLSISGFISGYFDNKVKASNLAYRIQHNNVLNLLVSTAKLKKLSLLAEKNLGVYVGNIILGVFLGSSFLLSFLLPFNVDIRHIAFSSSNLGYGIINHHFELTTIAIAVLSVFLIGVVNFWVSFSMTFLLVLKSRDLRFSKLSKLVALSIKDLLLNPLDYIMIRKNKASN